MYGKRTIIVTGGAGFVGSHLCGRLLREGARVLCVDNFYTGTKDNIKNFLNNDNFLLIEHDITEPLSLDEPIDEIYNLACPASPIRYQHNPVETVRTNVVGTANMLELAKEKNATILQASTSEIYGDPLVHPQKEEYRGNVNPLGPRACYDEGKRCAETLCMDYHREYGVKVKIVRIFNTYGPNMSMDDGRVVSNFIVQALRGDDITIYGDGMQTRSFQYIDDLIDAMLLMMGKNGFVGPVNLGNPNEFTIKHLAEIIMKKIPVKGKLVHLSLPADDPRQRRPDISLARAELGWQPNVGLEEGLEKTIRYFKNLE